MRTETTETVYNSKETAGTIEARVRRVVFNTSKFAEMENTAFWEDRPGSCVVIREGPDSPDTADIMPCAKISKAVADWANELFAWCMETPDEPGIGESSLIDEETGGWAEYAHRRVAVVMTDLVSNGGLRIEAFDRDGAKVMGIAFVPRSGDCEPDADITGGKRDASRGGGRPHATRRAAARHSRRT